MKGFSGRVLGVLGVLVVAGCIQVEKPDGTGGEGGGDGTNAAPRSNAGTGGTYLAGSLVELDGSASVDPEGGPLTYQWSLAQAPAGALGLSDTGTAQAEILLDVAGSYVVSLQVWDEHGASDTSTVRFEAEHPQVSVNAGEDATALLLAPVTFSGEAAAEDGSPLLYAWEIVTRPDDSVAELTEADTLQPTLVPDRVGTYVIRLVASTELATSSDELSLRVSPDQLIMNYQLVDMEYSDELDRMVIVSSTPNQLRLVDPETGEESTVALPKAPTAVSVEPGGLRAAVGYDGNISIVDLQSMTVLSSPIVSTLVGDIVFGADDRVHSFPRVDQWEQIHTTFIEDGTETLGGGIRAGTRARLNPVRTGVAYGADRGLSPSDIERYDVSSSPVRNVRDSPYHGDYAMCGDLWFTDDGASIITRCGNVFRSSDNMDLDMTYRGSLATPVVWVDHSSATGHIVAITQGGSFQDLEYGLSAFEDQFLAPVSSSAIPPALVAGQFRDTTPLFVTYNADASRLYIIVEAEGPFVLFRITP